MRKTFPPLLKVFCVTAGMFVLASCEKLPVTTQTKTVETKTQTVTTPPAEATPLTTPGRDMGAPVETDSTTKTTTKTVSRSSNCVDKSYTVEDGDTLWGIADSQYNGRGYLYPLIAEVNNIDDPYTIQPGDELTIPCCIPMTHFAKKFIAKKSSTTVTRKVTEKVVAPAPATPRETMTKVTPAPAPVVQPQPTPQPTPAPAPAAAPAPVQTQTQTQNVIVNVPPPAPASQPEPVRGPPAMTPVPVQPPTSTVVPPVRTPQVEEIPKPRAIGTITPGSLWNTAMMTPLEPGNKADYFHLDQGIIIARIGKIQVEPYVAVNAVKDTKGYQWNNRVVGEGGLKFVRPFSHGLVAIGGAYATEWRAGTNAANGALPSSRKSAPIAYLEDWFGWQQLTSRASDRKFLTGLPGSTWLKVGNISPYERNNVIGLARLEQGVTLVKTKHVALIPIGTFQIGMDSDKKPWNNRYTYGGGLKVAFPSTKAAFDIQGGYECASQYRGVPTGVAGFAPGSAACGPTARINLWTGWRHIGGE